MNHFRKWLILGFALILVFGACSNSEASQENEEEEEEIVMESEVLRISRPDESLTALAKFVNVQLWDEYVDKRVSISSDDPLEICFNIGVKSANAILSVFFDDYETAENMASSIRTAAEKLNIRSESVEKGVKMLLEDLQEEDPNIKEKRVSQSLNYITSEVSETMESMGSMDYALTVEFGVWIESIRQGSGIVKDSYSVDASYSLFRPEEAQYFYRNFQKFQNQTPRPFYKDAIETAKKLESLMMDDPISEDRIKEIHQASKNFTQKYIQ